MHMADAAPEPDAAREAVRAYERELYAFDWEPAFGEARINEGGNCVVPTTFRRGTRVVEYDVHVWSPSREGQMDPETSGAIAAATIVERLLKETARPPR